MTERERLIELLNKSCEERGWIMNGAGTITDYLLANGVIVPPCRVGQEVYFIKTIFSLADDPLKEKVCGMKTYSDNMKFTFVTASQRCFDEDKLGKTVFLTREEAEKALKGIG